MIHVVLSMTAEGADVQIQQHELFGLDKPHHTLSHNRTPPDLGIGLKTAIIAMYFS